VWCVLVSEFLITLCEYVSVSVCLCVFDCVPV